MTPEHDRFIEQYLSAYVDGAPLDADVRQQIEHLIASDPAYAVLYRTEAAVARLVRERREQLRYPAPADLHIAVRARLYRQQRRWQRWLAAAVGASLVLGLGIWYLMGPRSHASPPCFATALLKNFQQLQAGTLPFQPLADSASLGRFLQEHGIRYMPAFQPGQATLIGALVQRVDGYALPLFVYRSGDSWLLFSEAPQQDFEQRRLWLDSTIWTALRHHQWKWQQCDSLTTCAFWSEDSLVCGLVTALPPERVQQLLREE